MLRSILLSCSLLAAGPVLSTDVTFCNGNGAKNCFTGQFGLLDIDGDAKHKLLAADFGYVDPQGVGWQTNKGTKTDGASIPPLLQPFVGSPWEQGYIRAAVIHDWYCDRHVRPWKATHHVFYDAMIASGLNKAKAKLMFYAVYAFGPSWGYIVPGSKCAVTDNCIQNLGKDAVFVQLPDRYDDMTSSAELKAIETTIEIAEEKGGLSLDQLMAIADSAHPKQELLDNAPSSGVIK